jgi:hypothetical protein
VISDEEELIRLVKDDEGRIVSGSEIGRHDILVIRPEGVSEEVWLAVFLASSEYDAQVRLVRKSRSVGDINW